MALSAPEPIGTSHQVGDFTSGVFSLDEWLKRRAVANQASGAARTFVVCEADKVIGYYALASGSVTVAAAPGRFRRNLPEPIPVVVLARLAVDRAYHGRSLGRALVRDAARRVVHAADAIGIRGIVVHAISDDAKAFYLALGFEPSPIEPMTLMVTLADIRKCLALRISDSPNQKAHMGPMRRTGLFGGLFFSRFSKSYTGATAVLVDEFRRCFRRAPGPPPFSSINSTPAFSRALRMADALASVIAVCLSNEERATGLPLKHPDRR